MRVYFTEDEIIDAWNALGWSDADEGHSVALLLATLQELPDTIHEGGVGGNANRANRG